MSFSKKIPYSIIINTTTKIKFIGNKANKMFPKNKNIVKNIPDKPKFLPDYDEKYIQRIIRNGGL
jgi:hypothetical protein